MEPIEPAGIALKRLWEAGFIERRLVMMASRSTGLGYQHFVNVLTANGQRSVSPDMTRPRTISISHQTVDHSLAINDFYVLIHRAAELHGIAVHDWLDDRQLTAMQVKGSLKLVSIPDAFFVLAYHGRYFGHFLEIDTGTVRVGSRKRARSWTQTIANYGTYFREHYPHDGFFRGFSAPIVLTITRSNARLEHLLTATKHAGGAGVYWYTTKDQVEPIRRDAESKKVTAFEPEVLWRPIWRVLYDRAPRSLLDRLERSPNPPKRLDRV
ncbi:MAG: replication-relaxation family protein [Thermomicrobiales bacterium]